MSAVEKNGHFSFWRFNVWGNNIDLKYIIHQTTKDKPLQAKREIPSSSRKLNRQAQTYAIPISKLLSELCAGSPKLCNEGMHQVKQILNKLAIASSSIKW